MRNAVLAWPFAALVFACSSSGRASIEGNDPDAAVESGNPGGFVTDKDGGGAPGATDAGGQTKTTIYANTDDALYSLDPSSNAVTLIGSFTGGGGGASVTDCAVNAAGDLYVNTATSIFRAALPASGKGPVALTKLADIAGASANKKFYALAFAPAGVLGAGEGLIGGDADGVLWSIDPVTGAAHELGSFGPDKNGATFALSGDLVFYVGTDGVAKGLATIRSCKGVSCVRTDDYLAGIDMNALAAAFTSGTPATTLLSGIYGGSAATKGPGIGRGDLFGLGAWEGKVFGFQRSSANNGKPALIAIDATSGTGSMLSDGFSFTNGWSGACVTTKVTITVPIPPSAPH